MAQTRNKKEMPWVRSILARISKKAGRRDTHRHLKIEILLFTTVTIVLNISDVARNILPFRQAKAPPKKSCENKK